MSLVVVPTVLWLLELAIVKEFGGVSREHVRFTEIPDQLPDIERLRELVRLSPRIGDETLRIELLCYFHHLIG